MAETAETPQVKANQTPEEFLASLPEAPTQEQITTWKAQAPNGRINMFTPDGKRVYIMRGLTGLELSAIQKKLSSMATPVADPDMELQIEAVCKATVWTNAAPQNRLTDVILRTGTAGLPSSLFVKVSDLSDFMDPQKIEMMSADL